MTAKDRPSKNPSLVRTKLSKKSFERAADVVLLSMVEERSKKREKFLTLGEMRRKLAD